MDLFAVLFIAPSVHHPESGSNMAEIQSWFSSAIFYRVYVKAFCDSNADGQGDIQGLITRLQHIQDLGVNTVWLMPVFEQYGKGTSQGIVDFYKVQYEYGSMRDFELLVQSVHSRRMRLVLDLEMNHTSDHHPWFVSSRSDPQSQYRNYYIWSASDKKYHGVRHLSAERNHSNWHLDEESGQFYWSRFSASYPELNYDNPDVRTEMVRVMRFWLAKGVDGFCFEGLPYLFERDHTSCENLPETHHYIKAVRAFINQNFPERVLLGSMNQPPLEVEGYFGGGNELHFVVHPTLPAMLFLVMADHDAGLLKQIIDQMAATPDACQWVNQLTNPYGLILDQISAKEQEILRQVYAPDVPSRQNVEISRRLAPMLRNEPRAIQLLNALLFSLPGAPVVFYGDEIGMGDGVGFSDRAGLFFPMQWDETKGAGFSQAMPEKFFAPIINQPPYDQKSLNVAEMEVDPESHLNFMKHLIKTRRDHPELSSGTLEWLDTDNPSVVAFIRRDNNKALFVVYNMSDRTCGARIPREVRQESRLDLLNGYLRLQPDLTNITLKPYQFGWFSL